MEITGVKIYPVSEKKVKAYASVVFDRMFHRKGPEGDRR